MKITLLGTGTSMGVPIIACKCAVCHSKNSYDKRLRTAAMVQTHTGSNIVIDTGPDFRTQMLQANVQHLHSVLLTHSHKDHIAGLDDVRAFNLWQQKEIPLFANEFTINEVKTQFAYAFADYKYPGAPEIILNTINAQQTFEIDGIKIYPIEVIHGNMPILGFKFNHDIAYITDASHIAKTEIEKIKNVKVLIVNALRHQPHWSHFSLEQALQFVEKVQPTQATYFIHISHQLGLHHTVQAQLPPNVFLGYDNLTIEV